MQLKCRSIASLPLFAGLLALTSPLLATTLQIQAGRLETHGGFQSRPAHNMQILAADVGVSKTPAAGAINVPHTGEWHLWVESRSYPTAKPAERRFSIRLGQQMAGKIFGDHKLSTFRWEDGGRMHLASGPLLIVVGEQNTQNAQCGHIMLSDESEESSPERLFSHATVAEIIPLTHSHSNETPEISPVNIVAGKPLATMDNNLVRISFLSGSMSIPSGTEQAVIQHIEVRSGSGWKELSTTGGADSYRIIYRPITSDPHLVDSSTQFPFWDDSYAKQDTLGAGGASVAVHDGPRTAPWLAGELFPMRPVAAKKIDSETLELSFAPLPIGILTARWHLLPDQPSASVELSFHLSKPGYLSLGYHGAMEDAPQNLDFLMLPYLYLGHRFPDEAVTILSDRTPTPMALITRQNVSYAVMAEPGIIPFAWPAAKQARYALGIRNESGKAEPLLYMPLLGSEQSLHRTADVVIEKFRVWAQEGSWIDAYRGIVTQAFGLQDYRVPVTASLSDTLLNLDNLMKNDDASGWSAHAKGSWNIESRNTVTQPSPLTYLSYALLTGDEEFYKKYALLSLEFLLSRPQAHFSAVDGAGEDSNANLPLGGPNTTYTCAVYIAAFRMTQGATPAFANYCFKPDGSLYTHPSHYALFDDELALYETTEDKQWLNKAVESADKYIAENLTRLPTGDLGPEPFINVTFTPDWEGLLHLYEATHEARFLKAAHDTSYWLMTTIWTQPSIPNKPITVQPGNTYSENPLIWWKGDHRFRLGFMDEPAPFGSSAPKAPEISVPEATVPSWTVSQVGLGLEQPETYTQFRNDLNIMMSVWAPNLLSLYGDTGDTLYRTYARNATIGRFANYPGYYLSLFTNVTESPKYPLKGPDLTYFYYHHIAPFAAYIQDYVFTDAEVRSHGQFAFPSARQFGYVWFDSRLRGFAPGKVYGETAWPWIHPTAAVSNNKNVDIVLAHNRDTLYVALMNQTHSSQHVTLHLDTQVLGAMLDSRKVRFWAENKPLPARSIHGDMLEVDLPGDGFTVAAVDGLHIHVAAHEVMPPATMAVEPNHALETKAVSDSSLTATGMYITSPQFKSRELYVYVRANAKECSGASLVYRIDTEAEQRQTVDQFPCEFSVPLPFDRTPVAWRVEAVQTHSSNQ
jgi:hypothetical protein